MEELNIREAKNRRKKLYNELDVYLTQKKINFIKTQPASPIMRDIITGKNDGKMIFDKFNHYVIKDEKYDAKIYSIQEEINSLEEYIVKEMERVATMGGNELIKYYRDIEKMKWKDISKITHYSIRQCQNLYKK